MRRLTMMTAGLLVLGYMVTATAWAQNAHFIKGPTASLDTSTGDFTVSFKEAGLGNSPITYSITATTEIFTFQCFNHGGKTPQGSPNSVSFSSVVAETTITPRNGQISGSISLIPQLDGASCQGGGLELFLIAVDYEGVTFCDVTDNVCVGEPNLSATGLKIGPF